MRHSVPLPGGWEETPLSDVVEPRVEQRPPTGEPVPYVDISSIDRATKRIGELVHVDADSAPTRARQWVKAGDVLVSMTRPNLNAVAIVPVSLDGVVASTGFDVLRAVGVLPQWVFNRVRSHEFVSDVCENLQGVVYPAIRPRDVRAHKLPVPPLAEQQRIVDAIESYLTRLDNAVALLERVEQNLKRYRASVLKAAVEGRLVPTEAEVARRGGRSYEPASELLRRILAERKARWIEDAAEKARAKAEEKAREAGQAWSTKDNDATLEKERANAAKQYKEPAPPATTDLPGLPEGWCWATVEQLSSGTRPCAYGVLVPGPDVEDGVKLIRVGDVVDGEVKREALKRIARDVADRFPRTYLSGGEVLITLVGTIGRTAVVPESLAGANVARAVGVIVPSQQLSAPWIETWFRNPARAQIMSAKAHEVARKTLNLEDVRDAVVAIPPAAEQGRIVADLQRVDQVRKQAAEEVLAVRRRCARLKQSTLKWAFEGKLVEQDPSDGPASVLLDRIRAQRAAAGEDKPRARKRRSAE